MTTDDLSPTARRLLDHFQTPANRTRHLGKVKEALGLRLYRDAHAALDELADAGLIVVSRNGRLIVLDR